MATGGLPERVRRAVQLDGGLFDEVAADELATGQALVIALAAVALDALGEPGGLYEVMLGLAAGSLRFGLAVALAAGLGRLLDLRGGTGPVFRALGFATVPLALGLFDALPLLGGPFWLAKWGLVLAAWAIALRRVLRTEVATAAGVAAVALALGSLFAGALR